MAGYICFAAEGREKEEPMLRKLVSLLTVLTLLLLPLGLAEDASTGAIGGADGPTAIFVTTPAWTRPAWMAALLIIGVVGYLLLRRCKARSK